MDKWLDKLCRGVEAIMAAFLALMVVLVFGNVVLRYGFNSGITVSEELSRWLFIWITFLGALVALRERAHLGVDFVVANLPRWGKRACLVATNLLMLYILVLLFQGGLAQAKINWDVEAPTTGWSVAIIYIAGLVFSVLAAAVLLLELVRLLRGDLRDEELLMIQESEDATALAGLPSPTDGGNTTTTRKPSP